MTRPCYRQGENTARDRLEEAFWNALAEGHYEKMSVIGLCRAANVNKNTFYYHFGNIDDLAESAATSLLTSAFLDAVAQAVQGSITIPESYSVRDFSRALDRLGLMAANEGSPRLRQMLRDAVGQAWTEVFAIDMEALDLKELASFEFVRDGFLGVLAMRARMGNELAFEDVWGAPYQVYALSIIHSLQKASAASSRTRSVNVAEYQGR